MPKSPFSALSLQAQFAVAVQCVALRRGHTLNMLAHKGTYLVCKMLTTVCTVRVVRYCSKDPNKDT